MDENGVMGFKLEEEPKWITVTLDDGTVMQIKMEIIAIARNGNDVNTGLPIYMIQATNIMRLLKVPKDLIKKPESSENKNLYR